MVGHTDASTTKWHTVLPGALDSVVEGCALARRFSKASGLDDGASRALELVVEELVTNAVTHGGCAAMDLHLDCGVAGVNLLFADNGCAFNPLTDRPADPRELDFTEQPVGGLGWPLIAHYWSIEGCEREEKWNRLHLRLRPQTIANAKP
jgi:anti-sigma regulatory factor (Ser/Thr protein kinase)